MKLNWNSEAWFKIIFKKQHLKALTKKGLLF